MTWALVTGATGDHTELLRIGRPSMVRYAGRYGMEFIDADLVGEFPPSWLKIPAMIGALKDGAEGVLWVDADALFCRDDVWIGDLCYKPWNWVHNRYALGRDKPMVVPSCGVFAVRADGAYLLDMVWEKRNEYRDHGWWEQGAAHNLFGWRGEGTAYFYADTNWTHEQGTLPRDWNSQPHDLQPDPIVAHASGMDMASRKRWLKDVAASIAT